MTIYVLPTSSPALPQFPTAAALANNVRTRVLEWQDASWSLPLATILPTVISNTGSDASSVLQSTNSVYTSAGAVSNGGTYTLMKDGLDRLVLDLSFGRGVGVTPLGPTARIVFTDSTGSVGYDSAKTNVIGGAFLAINSTSGSLINNNHFNRIEFAEALKASSGVTINRRFSSTLKSMEDRAVFALTRPGTSSVVGMIAISRSAV